MNTNTPPADSDPALSARVRLDPCVEFISRRIGDESFFVARHSQRGKYYELGHDEYAMTQLLEEWREVSELHSLGQLAGVAWSQDDVAVFVGVLVKEHMVLVERTASDSATGAPAGVASKSRLIEAWKRTVSLLSFSLSQRFPLFHADALTTRINGYFGWAFGRYGFLLWCVLALSGLANMTLHRSDLMHEMGRMFSGDLWPLLALGWCLSKLIHEFGHAVAAKRQNVKVGDMGVMFFLFAPLAYVDVTDAWRLPGRWARARIAMAGVYTELAVASLALWGYVFLPDGLLRHLCAQAFVITGPATLLVNANPLLRLDGYYVFSDLTDIANLRMHGRRQLLQGIERVLFGIPRTHRMLSGWRRSVATLHALGSVLFQAVWMGGLVFAISTWAKGIGLLLAGVAVLLWCVIPLARWAWKIWWIEPSIGQRRRLISYGLLASGIIQYISLAPSPIGRRVPVVVRFHNEQIARATADAFVESIIVRHGQKVEPGMLLVVLVDPELQQLHDSKVDDLAISEMRVIQFRQKGEHASAATEAERAEGLKRQLSELAQQVDGLRVVANRRGIVMRPMIEELQGQYLKQGQEILRVGDPHEMELLVSVAENDTQAYRQACENNSRISVRLRGGTWIEAAPAPLRPRADVMLPHPALASSAGGPLAVEPSFDQPDQMRMIQPRLEGVSKLDPVTSLEVRSGQIGSMSISDTRPLMRRITDSFAPGSI